MDVLLMYSALVLAPTVVLLGVDRTVLWWAARTKPCRTPQPSGRPVEQLTADLARLDAEQRSLSRAPVTTRGLRLRAVSLAYDDTLRACCRAVGVAEPPTPLSSVDRLVTEALLAQHGLTW